MGMTSYCFIAAQFLRDPLKSGVQVTPAFLRSTKPSKRESGLVAAAPSTSVQAGPNSSGGVYGPPRPYSPDTAAHRGRITGDFMTEKNNSSLLQHRKTQQAAESMTGQRPVSFPALRPLAAKWVRASARNCGWRIAGRDACPALPCLLGWLLCFRQEYHQGIQMAFHSAPNSNGFFTRLS